MATNGTAPRLKEHYDRHVRPKLQEEFRFTNPHEVPKLVKVVLNVGMGEASKDQKLLESLVDELTTIAGQKALVNKARMAIANFNLRQGAPIGVSVTLQGGRAVLEVSDHGPGVPASERQRIFEPFYRLAGGSETGRGSGLGLALVLDIARRHGGDAVCLAAESGGSRFRIDLPAA